MLAIDVPLVNEAGERHVNNDKVSSSDECNSEE